MISYQVRRAPRPVGIRPPQAAGTSSPSPSFSVGRPSGGMTASGAAALAQSSTTMSSASSKGPPTVIPSTPSYFDDDDDSILKCGICFHEYDVAVALPADAHGPDRRPCLSRTCCHSLCIDCAQGMVGTEQGREGNCPFCRQPQAFPHGRSYGKSSGRKVVNHLTMRLLLLHNQRENEKILAEAAAAVAVAASVPAKKDASTQLGKGFKLKPPPPKPSPAAASTSAAASQTTASSPPSSVAASTTTRCSGTPTGPTVTTATVVSPDESVSASTPASSAASASTFAGLAADSVTFHMGVPGEKKTKKSSRKKNRPFSWRDMQKSGRWAAQAPPITSPLTAAGLGRTARLHRAMMGRGRLEGQFQSPAQQSPTITKDPAHPINVPENANRLFELISERQWVDAHQRAQTHPDEATRRFVSKGRYTTLVHAALYFGAPYALMQLLAEIDPAALYVRSWFMDKNEKLLPVDWAKQLFRLDLVPLLEPPELSLAAALSAITVSDTVTQAVPDVAAEAGAQASTTENGTFEDKDVERSSSTAAESSAAAPAFDASSDAATTSADSVVVQLPAKEKPATEARICNAATVASNPRDSESNEASGTAETGSGNANDITLSPVLSGAPSPIAGSNGLNEESAAINDEPTSNSSESTTTAVAVAAESDSLPAPTAHPPSSAGTRKRSS